MSKLRCPKRTMDTRGASVPCSERARLVRGNLPAQRTRDQRPTPARSLSISCRCAPATTSVQPRSRHPVSLKACSLIPIPAPRHSRLKGPRYASWGWGGGGGARRCCIAQTSCASAPNLRQSFWLPNRTARFEDAKQSRRATIKTYTRETRPVIHVCSSDSRRVCAPPLASSRPTSTRIAVQRFRYTS